MAIPAHVGAIRHMYANRGMIHAFKLVDTYKVGNEDRFTAVPLCRRVQSQEWHSRNPNDSSLPVQCAVCNKLLEEGAR